MKALGIAEYEKWMQLDDYHTAYEQFPKAVNDNELWHVWYFFTEPKNFMWSILNYSQTLDPNAKKSYLETIGGILRRNFDSGTITNGLITDKAAGEWFIVNVLPDYGEWYNAYSIITNLSSWIKDQIKYHSALTTQDQREVHISEVKRLLETHENENWPQKISEDLMRQFSAIFLKDEIAKAEIAEAKFKNIENAKLIGALALTGFGLFVISKMFPARK